MKGELRPWEVVKMIEDAGGPVEIEVLIDGSDLIDGSEWKLRNIQNIDFPSDNPYYDTKGVWHSHARHPQKQERRKITDRYKLMKLCKELDAQGNGILVRLGDGYWMPSMYFGHLDNAQGYQYTNIDDNGQPTGEPQDFWEQV